MSTNLLGAIVFIAVFAGIILIHEFGHYIISLLMRIDVEEFGIFFPPRLLRMWRNRGTMLIGKQKVTIPRNTDLPFDPQKAISRHVDVTADEIKGKMVLRSIKFSATEDGQVPLPANAQSTPVEEEKLSDFGKEVGAKRLSGVLKEINQGTEFTLNLIPLGGFNRIKGESDPDVPHGLAAASPWKRIPVYLGGAALNLLTGVIVYMVLFSQMGVPDSGRILVAEVTPASPAEAAQLQPGDLILEVDGKGMSSINHFIDVIQVHPEEEVILTIERDGVETQVPVTPEINESNGMGRIGVALTNPYRPMNSFWETIPLSLQATYGFTEQMLAMPGRLIAGTLSPEEAQMGGPRTIWMLFQQAVAKDSESRLPDTGGTAAEPSYYTLLLIISLTISVGVLNLFPIPALDGGRIFMSLIEIVIRRPIPGKYQTAINSIGFVILLVVLGVFYIKDFISPVAITLP